GQARIVRADVSVLLAGPILVPPAVADRRPVRIGHRLGELVRADRLQGASRILLRVNEAGERALVAGIRQGRVAEALPAVEEAVVVAAEGEIRASAPGLAAGVHRYALGRQHDVEGVVRRGGRAARVDLGDDARLDVGVGELLPRRNGVRRDDLVAEIAPGTD